MTGRRAAAWAMAMAITMLLFSGCAGCAADTANDAALSAIQTPRPVWVERTAAPAAGEPSDEAAASALPEETDAQDAAAVADGTGGTAEQYDSQTAADGKPYELECLFRVECETHAVLRSEPDDTSGIIDRLKPNYYVHVLSYVGKYAEVHVMNTHSKGYMLAGFLEPTMRPVKLEAVRISEDYSYDEMCEDMHELYKHNADKVEITSIGTSVEGREIYAMTIGARCAKHNVLVVGGECGSERMTSAFLMALAEDWLMLGANGSVRFHIIPMLNPDGVTISLSDESTKKLEFFERMDAVSNYTRLSGKEYLSHWEANANGIDISLNFRTLWSKVANREHPSFAGYKGEKPMSEPETLALSRYTRGHKFDLALVYRATGSRVYWHATRGCVSDTASHEFAMMLCKLSDYELDDGEKECAGGFREYASIELGIPAVTVEVGTMATPLPINDFNNIWLRNRYTFKTVLSWLKAREQNCA